MLSTLGGSSRREQVTFDQERLRRLGRDVVGGGEESCPESCLTRRNQPFQGWKPALTHIR